MASLLMSYKFFRTAVNKRQGINTITNSLDKVNKHKTGGTRRLKGDLKETHPPQLPKDYKSLTFLTPQQKLSLIKKNPYHFAELYLNEFEKYRNKPISNEVELKKLNFKSQIFRSNS